jgi:predicted DNA-binding transcriptional regulator YafY
MRRREDVDDDAEPELDPEDDEGRASTDPKVAKLERQLNLVSYLLSARSPVPFSDIRGKVVGYDDEATPDAVEKRFDRDKADLRSIGVDIDYVANDAFGRAGYVIDPRGYFLRETTLAPEDAMLLAVLQRALGVVDDALGRNLKSALAKLTIDSRLPEPLRASVAEQHLLTLGRPEKDPGRTHLAVLGEALGRRRRVSFRYHTVDAQRVEKRTVRPYGLGVVGGNWHLVGWDEERQGLRNFRLDRIRNKVVVVDGADGAYEVPADFDITRQVEMEEFEIPDGPEVKVRVEFDAVATWLLERRRQGVGTLTRQDDGTGIFEVGVRSEEGLFRWLAEFGERAKLVAPPRLVDAYRERIAHARARYRDVPAA